MIRCEHLSDRETNSTLNLLCARCPLSSPFGFNGGEWYLQAGFNF